MDIETKMKELCKDEAFLSELLSQETPEDAQAFFRKHGFDFSMDEIKSIGNGISKGLSGELDQDKLRAMANGELSEEELEEAAGGLVILASTAALVAYSVVGAVAGGATVAGTVVAVKFRSEIATALEIGASFALSWIEKW